MPRFVPQAAVVTGAGSGLGRALALALARQGADVVVSDVVEDRIAPVVDEVEALGRRALGHACDVSDADAVAGLHAAAVAAFPDLDVWVNNAGVSVAGEVGEVPLEDWRWILQVNLFGVIHGCHVAAPRFRERRRGRFLNVASAAALAQAPNMAPYNVTKTGVVSLTESMRVELRAHGCDATVLCPTFFQTDLLSNHRGGDERTKRIAAKLMRVSRYTAEDVARTAVDDLRAGRLYSVPMHDGAWAWRLRRLFPTAYHDLLAKRVYAARMRKR